MAGFMPISALGGEQALILVQPATFAVVTVIIADAT